MPYYYRPSFPARLLRDADILLVSLLAIYTGLWFGNPYWSVMYTAPQFEVMREIVHPVIWGLALVLLGAGRILAFLVEAPQIADWVDYLLSILWLVMALVYFAGGWQNPGSGVMLILAAITFIDSFKVTVSTNAH